MTQITLDRMVECARREVKMRRQVYPRWVETGRLTKAKADEEIAVMEEIARTLASQAAGSPQLSGRLL